MVQATTSAGGGLASGSAMQTGTTIDSLHASLAAGNDEWVREGALAARELVTSMLTAHRREECIGARFPYLESAIAGAPRFGRIACRAGNDGQFLLGFCTALAAYLAPGFDGSCIGGDLLEFDPLAEILDNEARAVECEEAGHE